MELMIFALLVLATASTGQLLAGLLFARDYQEGACRTAGAVLLTLAVSGGGLLVVIAGKIIAVFW